MIGTSDRLSVVRSKYNVESMLQPRRDGGEVRPFNQFKGDQGLTLVFQEVGSSHGLLLHGSHPLFFGVLFLFTQQHANLFQLRRWRFSFHPIRESIIPQGSGEADDVGEGIGVESRPYGKQA